MFKKKKLIKLTVVIPSKNGLHLLKECLPSVVHAANKAQNKVHIVVVDDNSEDNTLKIAPKLFPSVVFLANKGNGTCSARNMGAHAFTCDWLVFLDNDVQLEPSFFNTLSTYLREDIFCVSCAGYLASSKQQIDGIKLLEWKRGILRFTQNIFNTNLPDMSIPYPTLGIQGAYFACNRIQFDELGGFDELFEPYMLEETDLAYNGLKQGWKIIYAPNTKPLHKCGSTIQSKTNPYTQQLAKRNRILFVWKNIHSPLLLANHWGWVLIRFQFKAIWQAWKQWKHKKPSLKKDFILSDYELLKESKLLVKRFKGDKR